MSDIREKLVELLREVQYLGGLEEKIADHLIDNGVTVQEWIPVTERLPDSGTKVMLCCKYTYSGFPYVCCGFYAEAFKEECGCQYDCEIDYNEEDDAYYLKAGWYETIMNWNDYSFVAIEDSVTHWMPLPTPPKGE